MMLGHHIKVAVRSIRKQGVYAVLNIFGLSLGLVLGLFVILLVKHELSYDTSFFESHRIYRMATKGVLGNNLINSATSPMPLAGAAGEMDEVEEIVRFIPGANNLVQYKDKRYNENGFLFGDENFFKLFDLEIIDGGDEVILDDPGKVIVSRENAKKYFGNESALGKTIERDGIKYQVVGVCENVPNATHFNFGFVASLSTIDEILLKKGDSAYVSNWKADWLYLNCYTYLRLKNGVVKDDFVQKLNKAKDEYLTPQLKQIMDVEHATDSIVLSFFAQPIRSIHFNSHLDSELSVNSKPIYVKLFVFVAIFVLLTTCVNFMNLTTAKLRVKYQEVGYRQLVGATRGQLISQFLVEALVYGLGAMFISMVLLELLLPLFNDFFGLSLQFSFLRGWVDFFGILVVLLFVGLLAGSFPAFFFSARKPEKLISGIYNIGRTGFVIRGLLVTSQFGVAMFLAVVATAMWWQINYVKTSDHGFEQENIIVVERGHAVRNDFSDFKTELCAVEGVELVSACNSLPGDDYFQGTFRMRDGKDDKVVMLPLNYVDEDFFNLLGIKLKVGRFLSNDLGDSLGVNLNVAAVEQLKLSKPLDEKIEVFGDDKWSLNTVGVVKDFHYESYFSKVKPLALILLPQKMRFEYVLIKVKDKGAVDVEAIQSIWEEYSDGAPFVFSELDNRLNGLYEEDVRISKIMSVFAVLSLFVALLGVIALVAFIIEYKSDSFAVKGVLGAPRQSIMSQVFSMYGVYVVVGVVLASIPSYWAIQAWGSTYAYFDFIGFHAFVAWAFILVALSFAATIIQTIRGTNLRSYSS